MIGACCLHGLFAHLVHPGMHLSAYLFIIPVSSSLHLSYFKLQCRLSLYRQTDAMHLLVCMALTQKHFGTFVRTKCNLFLSTARMIVLAQNFQEIAHLK